uniref:Uncharacterized protein n=1 Tax=Strix occidentalis caurina TaxID=311401 RepID=A0A8D0KZ97_STROC
MHPRVVGALVGSFHIMGSSTPCGSLAWGWAISSGKNTEAMSQARLSLTVASGLLSDSPAVWDGPCCSSSLSPRLEEEREVPTAPPWHHHGKGVSLCPHCLASPKGSPKNSLKKKLCKLLTGIYKRKAPRSSPGEDLLLLEQRETPGDLVHLFLHSQPDTSQTR